MTSYYVYENAYWEGPTEEMPEGAKQVPKRRNLMDRWDGSQWVYDKGAQQTEYIGDVNKELCRIQKFYSLPTLLLTPLLGDLTAYSAALRAYVKNVQSGVVPTLPPCPASLTDLSYFNL